MPNIWRCWGDLTVIVSGKSIVDDLIITLYGNMHNTVIMLVGGGSLSYIRG